MTEETSSPIIISTKCTSTINHSVQDIVFFGGGFNVQILIDVLIVIRS